MSLSTKFSLILALIFLPLFSYAEMSDTNLLAEGRLDEAVTVLQSKIKSAPQDAEAYSKLCRAYFDLSDWDNALPACERAVNLSPESSNYHLWLGRVYGRKAEAAHFASAYGWARKLKTQFETAVQLDPKNLDALSDLAEFYLEAPAVVGGGRAKAEDEATAMEKLDPAKADWVFARLAEKKKDFTAAQNFYRAAIQASHGTAQAWFDLALFESHAGDAAQMQDAIHKASAAPLNQPEILLEAADLLIQNGRDLPLAKQLLQRYLAGMPSRNEALAFKAHYLLGKLLEQEGNETGARGEYVASLALDHSYEPSLVALNRVSLAPAAYHPGH
jgi:cytochrome c-type biogenesis protein CcmH/NrfG